MSALRERMSDDMKLAGLSTETRRKYLGAISRLSAHFNRPPDQLSEEEVRTYLVALFKEGAARGTFKVAVFGIKFFYYRTLGRDWPLVTKKDSDCRSRSVYQTPWPTSRFAVYSAA